MKKIIILSSPTLHHIYFINRLLREGISIHSVIYETSSVRPDFEVGPCFEQEQERFEKEHFFSLVADKLPDNLKVHYVPTVNTDEAKAIIAMCKPDLGIVFGCGRIKPDVIKSAKDGLINIHRGIAEQYRGLDCDLWPVYHDDFDNIGVTIHKVEEDLDTGDILECGKLRMQKGMKVYQLRYYTTVMACDLLSEPTKRYQNNGGLKARRQKSRGRYYSFMPLELKKIVVKKFDNYVSRLPKVI